MYTEKNLPKTNRSAAADLYPLYHSLPPYTFTYEKVVGLEQGPLVHIRPICCEDEQTFRRFFESVSDESIFYRFGQYRINLTYDYLAQLCRVDYDRDFAFLAVVRAQKEVIIGEARLNRLADPESAELSFIVADQWQGKGIGNILMEFCLVVSKDLGLKALVMEVMKCNTRMKRFGYKYGFHRFPNTKEGDMEEVLQLKIGQDKEVSHLNQTCSEEKWLNRQLLGVDEGQGPMSRAPSSYELPC
jgi:acetyltransferase